MEPAFQPESLVDTLPEGDFPIHHGLALDGLFFSHLLQDFFSWEDHKVHLKIHHKVEKFNFLLTAF